MDIKKIVEAAKSGDMAGFLNLLAEITMEAASLEELLNALKQPNSGVDNSFIAIVQSVLDKLRADVKKKNESEQPPFSERIVKIREAAGESKTNKSEPG